MNNRDKLNDILIEYNRIYSSDIMISKIFKSEYNCQAIEFLLKTKTKIDITSNGQAYPNWQDQHIVNRYTITLKNSRHEYKFDFHDSIRNTQDNKSMKYDFYSALAGLGHDTPESFDEFCLDYGYQFENESEYIKTKSIHLDCLEQNKNIEKLFTYDEIQLLQEIN